MSVLLYKYAALNTEYYTAIHHFTLLALVIAIYTEIGLKQRIRHGSTISHTGSTGKSCEDNAMPC